jgi:hypothetical protein
MPTTTQSHLILAGALRKRAEKEVSNCDRILSLLEAHGGEKQRRQIRDRLHLVYRDLDPLLDELEKQGLVKIELGEKGGSISLRKKSTRPRK